MKNLFAGFYPQPVERLDKNTKYVFDTNVLLNIFRYPKEPREILIEILNEISPSIWIPFQIAMEYHHNVLEEIETQNKAYDNLIKSLNEKYDRMKEDFQKYAQRHINLQMDDDLLSGVKKALDKVIDDLNDQKSKHPNLFELQESLSTIIGNNVGETYSQDELDKLYKEGEERYSKNIPPGFRDKTKGTEIRLHNGILHQTKYGDFILWRQMLDYFKEENNKVVNVVFVSDDTKSDWWKSIKGIKRPHPELIQEFTRECKNTRLYIFTAKQFLSKASELTGINLDPQKVEGAIKGIDDYKKKKNEFKFDLKNKKFNLMSIKQVDLKKENEIEKDNNYVLFSNDEKEVESSDNYIDYLNIFPFEEKEIVQKVDDKFKVKSKRYNRTIQEIYSDLINSKSKKLPDRVRSAVEYKLFKISLLEEDNEMKLSKLIELNKFVDNFIEDNEF